MHVAAIIAAGGRGVRVGGELPKQFVDLGDGSRMITRSLDVLLRSSLVDEVVVALPQGGWQVDARPGSKPVRCVTGGERRQDSVAAALGAVSDATTLVVIHDAARPFVTVELIDRTIRAAEKHGAAIAALPATDTIKQAGEPDADGSRAVRATLARDTIFLAQTPQAFRRDVLVDAMAAAHDSVFTDEAMLVERAGFAVHLVAGDPANIKVTTAHDLEDARSRVTAKTMRVGTGYDLHRLIAGRRLMLAGVHVPFDRGLDGHSDADIVCHAVTDAILGAAGAGDIGRLFPNTDPRWKDADSLRLLEDAVRVVRSSGFRVSNVDVTVIAELPKLVPHLDAMRANLARALGVDASCVSIKGKTNESVDAVGRGDAMACHAVALLASI
jgi:2-C-methyl-D-erythritol 4-phosphate cytidylyltransferase/2-C-methyl-D-erythritol 2,4-cyclodiphosphate synthase